MKKQPKALCFGLFQFFEVIKRAHQTHNAIMDLSTGSLKKSPESAYFQPFTQVSGL